jgi:ankyrin repeat protein
VVIKLCRLHKDESTGNRTRRDTKPLQFRTAAALFPTRPARKGQLHTFCWAAHTMAATAGVQKTPKQTVLDVLGLMVGADLVRAMEAAFDTSDFTSLQSTLPVLGSAGVRALHQAAFEAACAQGRADVAQVLLASESVNAAAAVTTLGVTRTLLQHAVHSDCPDVVRVLLTDASVEATMNDPHGEEDEWDKTGLNAPLLLAAGLGHVECLQELLASARVDIHALGHEWLWPMSDECSEPITPLGSAAHNGHLPCVRALLAADGIDVNCVGGPDDPDDSDDEEAGVYSALMLAACAGQVHCLQALLAADGIDINLLSLGRTALMMAADVGQLPCLLALLNADGISTNLQGCDGDTALGHALAGGHISAAEALLAVEGIDASLANNNGYTPLHDATTFVGYVPDMSRMLHTIQLLLQRKEVHANAATSIGETPLHLACLRNHPGMVRALLLGGGCRFKLTTNSQHLRQGLAPLGMTTNPDVRTLLASGIDYWQRKYHAHHSWSMKQVVLTLLLVAQRIGIHAEITQPPALSGDAHTPVQHPPLSLPLLPEEIWMELLGFLRSADASV